MDLWKVTLYIRAPGDPREWDWPVLLDEQPENIEALDTERIESAERIFDYGEDEKGLG